ncbi:MAG: DUF3761 domain-containing protein [Actinomycetes bacterium]
MPTAAASTEATVHTAGKPAPAHHATSPAPRATQRPVQHTPGPPMPNRQLTPGEVFAGVGPTSFCVSGYTTHVRHVTQSMRYQVFAEYHIPYDQHSAYEVDHLIPLELGGDNSIKNLWPEKGSIPNSKDGLENQLHNLVCHGQLATSTAQRAIATNWVAALRTYGSAGAAYERAAAPAPTKSATTQSTNPTGATAKCNDGTYSYAAHHQGACSHHGGVAVWYR